MSDCTSNALAFVDRSRERPCQSDEMPTDENGCRSRHVSDSILVADEENVVVFQSSSTNANRTSIPDQAVSGERTSHGDEMNAICDSGKAAEAKPLLSAQTLEPTSREQADTDGVCPRPSSEARDPHLPELQGSKSRPETIGDQLYVVFVILFFAGSSLGAIFINKTCLTGYHFKYPLTLMFGQMLFAIVVLTVLHLTHYMTIPSLRRQDVVLMAVPTALFTSNVIVGLSALSLVNIPMFSAFRRLTLLFVMVAEYLFLKKTHPTAIVNAVVVMTFGAFISAIDDVSFSRLGYCLVFLNNILTALYLAAIKRVMKDSRFQPLPLLYYTALMGLPLVSILLVVTGELRHVVTAFKTQPELLTPAFGISLTLTASGAFAVNFSTSLCTHVTSPLTTSVAGQVKNVLQTVLGFFSWGFVPTKMNMFGLLVALGAQLVFAYLKYQENKNPKATEEHEPDNAALKARCAPQFQPQEKKDQILPRLDALKSVQP